ncbi:lactate/malate dehydrogenase family protein [Tautonia plasticadhaerens]|uniref:L-lactate dehydrogenase n=1 Tax=Tautonia plasticadhaerens TaxID=2527974 RepID=A0A518H6Z9_9BACT|nr:lactate/malate dehydrogenase family protein [Tautonia plasticadhaerens]QDV36659.1 L-lactate dehydrogenase [Tautonia plasticadhaerens]
MRVGIIGGGGLVGSCTGFALQCGGVVPEINLIDVNGDLCRGQALDILHGAALVADQRIRATGYESIPETDLVCITAGLRRKPDESRLDLINRNVELFLKILDDVMAAGLRDDAIVLVVSNPVDVLTYLATRRTGLPPRQVIGLGTMLDSSRFRGLIAQDLGLPATQVTATILGEHGDSMVPLWSVAQAAGLPLEKYPGWSPSKADELFKRTKGSGAEVIKLKGGAGFAVGISIREVIHTVALDSRRILPVSSLVSGQYGMGDVCISVPTVVGEGGVRAQLELDLWPKELSGLQQSARVLRETIDQVLKTNPNAAKAAAGRGGNGTTSGASRGGPPPASANGQGVRVTMGSGGSNASAGRPRVTISGQSGGGRGGY